MATLASNTPSPSTPARKTYFIWRQDGIGPETDPIKLAKDLLYRSAKANRIEIAITRTRPWNDLPQNLAAVGAEARSGSVTRYDPDDQYIWVKSSSLRVFLDNAARKVSERMFWADLDRGF